MQYLANNDQQPLLFLLYNILQKDKIWEICQEQNYATLTKQEGFGFLFSLFPKQTMRLPQTNRLFAPNEWSVFL